MSDHNPVFLKICLNNRTRHTVWRLNTGILNSEQRKERIKADITKYIEENDNGAVDPTILWDAMKAVIRGKLIAETANAKNIKLEAYRKYSKRLRELEREFQNTKESETDQEIKHLRTKINDLLLDEIEKRNKFVKQNYYETGPRATKLLAKRLRKQQVINTINKIRDPDTNVLTYAPENIEIIFQDYYRQLYTQPTSADKEEMRAFLNSLDLPSIGNML